MQSKRKWLSNTKDAMGTNAVLMWPPIKNATYCCMQIMSGVWFLASGLQVSMKAGIIVVWDLAKTFHMLWLEYETQCYEI